MYSHEEYQSRIHDLFERHQSVQSVGFTSDAYKPGLEGMKALAASLGNPQESFRCIHVAGTNGKGSVCSMIAAGLAGNGLKVGLYTSPHLLDFRERIKIVDGDSFSMIPESDVLNFLDSADLEGRSFFEVTTAMAFWWFAVSKVDYAVIEVGLGGLLDSTNIVSPELSVITSIGLDHCAILGATRSLIAAQKAGIFKPGVPALVWGHDPETDPVFVKLASETGSRLSFADDWPTPQCAISDIEGPCSLVNSRTVNAVFDILGLQCNRDSLSHAGRVTGFHGRWELVHTAPDVICDIGHNPPALKLVFSKLEALGRPLVIVYGVMADKDLDGISSLLPSSAEYVLVSPDTTRALPAARLALRLSELRPDIHTTCSDSVAEGVQAALRAAESLENPLVFIGGSTFVVSEALLYLKNNCAV
ncbi:MAG: bifunctional folylpolyglutamate synthase/dihydrofolate synthase [Bacteroidales bacterium]|nr:bifunctional folylpolyglutamate synthase/dihydrofolate synthase [Bacteroidales bacterium]